MRGQSAARSVSAPPLRGAWNHMGGMGGQKTKKASLSAGPFKRNILRFSS
jgi:hypothetical protein